MFTISLSWSNAALLVDALMLVIEASSPLPQRSWPGPQLALLTVQQPRATSHNNNKKMVVTWLKRAFVCWRSVNQRSSHFTQTENEHPWLAVVSFVFYKDCVMMVHHCEQSERMHNISIYFPLFSKIIRNVVLYGIIMYHNVLYVAACWVQGCWLVCKWMPCTALTRLCGRVMRWERGARRWGQNGKRTPDLALFGN